MLPCHSPTTIAKGEKYGTLIAIFRERVHAYDSIMFFGI